MLHATFSIVGRAEGGDAYGVAVSTARPAVGAFVPWVSLHGAVATQARTRTSHGRRGVALLEAGVPVTAALEGLLSADEGRGERQLHGVDAAASFAFTGDACVPWAGHRSAGWYSVAGNMLAGPQVLLAMAEAYERADAEELAARLLLALEAGQAAGGDKRGKISAALLVASREPRPYHNLRVDAHERPVAELRRVFELSRADFAELSGRHPGWRPEGAKW